MPVEVTALARTAVIGATGESLMALDTEPVGHAIQFAVPAATCEGKEVEYCTVIDPLAPGTAVMAAIRLLIAIAAPVVPDAIDCDVAECN